MKQAITNKKTITLIILFASLLFIPILAESTDDNVFTQNEADHSIPNLYETIQYQDEVPSGFELHENQEYTFFIHSQENPNNVSLVYETISSIDLCETVNSETGEIRCAPNHEMIAGTSEPAQKQPLNHSILIQAIDESEEEDKITGKTHRFTLIPGNNQAIFNQTPTNETAEAGTEWNPEIQAYDLELDYPLEYSVSGDLLDEHPGIISVQPQNSNATKANIVVNEQNNAFTNAQQGNWTITLEVTDSLGSNQSRPKTTYNFTLQVLGSNFPPEITSNQDDLVGTQYEDFNATITATDVNENDTLTFELTEPSNSSMICPVSFPWNITTIDSSAENATAQINETLNINHVICRYANLTVTDQDGLFDSEIVFFNITNINDPPTIHRYSEDGDIENQIGYLFVDATYQVNASDPDELTYNADEFANLTYYVNDSRFDINEDGEISYFFTEESELGNYTINVTVSDGEYNDSRLMNIEINDNAPPQISLSNLQSNYSQYDEITFNIEGFDAGGTNFNLNRESTTNFLLDIYNITLASDETNSSGRYKTWTVNMTKNKDIQSESLKAIQQIGEHELELTLTDELGSSTEISEATAQFTIFNENDAPFFDVERNNMTTTQSSFENHIGNIVFDREVNVELYATDFDLFITPEFASENLEFYGNTTLAGVNDFTVEKTSNNTARLTFTPTQLGSGNLTLGVVDEEGEFDERTYEITVIEQTDPPSIDFIKPFDDDGSLGNAYSARSNFEFDREDVFFEENTTVVFDAITTLDDSLPNNTFTYKWYVNDVLVEELVDVEPDVDSQFEYYFDFFSSNQTQEVRLVVEDAAFSTDEFLWLNNIENVNRDPLFIGPMEDLTVDSTQTFGNYLSYRPFNQETGFTQRFYDPDDDPTNTDSTAFRNPVSSSSLDITLQGGCASSGVADFVIQGDDFRVIPKVIGQCQAVFNATDEFGGSVLSDTVVIEVLDVEDESPEETSGGGGATQPQPIPIEEEVETPHPFNLVIPDTATTYVGQSIEIPISIENTWSGDVQGVDLNSVALDATFTDEEATFEFGRSRIPVLPMGQSVNTTLTVTNFRSLGPYEIRINATSQSPEFEDSATILINSLEMFQDESGEAVESRVTFARELLSENVECQELNELLNRASDSLASGDVSEAARMVDAAINGCRHVMGQDVRRDTPSALVTGLTALDTHSEQFLFFVGILTLVSLLSLGAYLVREKVRK